MAFYTFMKKLKALTKLDYKIIKPLKIFYEHLFYLFYQERYTNNEEISKYIGLHRSQGYYPCIPVLPTIIEKLFFIRKNFPLKKHFLDVGCGYGHIVSLANSIGFSSYGIDIQSSEKLKSHSVSQQIEYNCDAFSFKRYDDYDVIFFYQPISNAQLCAQMYEYVVKSSKKGTIFLVEGHTEVFFRYCYKISEDYYNIFIKN